jgi:hypothetical protein
LIKTHVYTMHLLKKEVKTFIHSIARFL